MPDQRQVIESPIDQGELESVQYSFDFVAAGVGTIVGLPSFALIRSDGLDVTATCIPAGPAGTVVGLIATSPIVMALDADRYYRLYCRVTHDGAQIGELYCVLRGRA